MAALLLSQNAAVFPTAAFFVSRSPRVWLVTKFFILLFFGLLIFHKLKP